MVVRGILGIQRTAQVCLAGFGIGNGHGPDAGVPDQCVVDGVDVVALLVVHGVAGGIIVLFVGIQIAAEEILTAVSGKADGISVAVNIILVD